jgi:hypothetical protein
MGCANNPLKNSPFAINDKTIKRVSHLTTQYLSIMQLDNPLNINKRY